MNTLTRTLQVTALLALICAFWLAPASSAATPATATTTADAAPLRLPLNVDTYKIEIDADGVYELRIDDLAAAGMDVVNLDPSTIEMMHQGQPVSTQFVGDDDNLFEADETLRFYGQAFNGTPYDKLYVGNNVYWLWAGEERLAN